MARRLVLATFQRYMANSTQGPPVHAAAKPLAWLLGKWVATDGKGYYPTIDDFTYREELEFFHSGQPNIQFNWYSFHPTKGNPMHREVGFIRIKPGTNQIAINAAHNTGLAEVEEGTFDNGVMKLESHSVGRLSFGKPPAVKKIKREFHQKGEDSIEQVVWMETSNTDMTEHLRILYKKVDS